jgi:predicted nucleic acid-binding protein
LSLVIDASILVAWFLDEKSDPRVEAAFDMITRVETLAPSLFHYEIRNALLVSERRNRITEAMSAAFLRDLGLLPIRLEPAGDEGVLMTVTRKRKLTVYDAAYLELAKREALPLATLDRDLEKAAIAEGVALSGLDPQACPGGC